MDKLTITVEDAEVIRALEAFPEDCLEVLMPVHRATADRIADGQRRRVRVMTGHTRDQIRVERDESGTGYIVIANDKSSRAHVELYLEHGTRYSQAFPFFDEPAKVEEGPHRRAVTAAVQRLIADKGMGHG